SMRVAPTSDAAERAAPKTPETQTAQRPSKPEPPTAPRRIRGVQLIVGGTLLGLVLLLAMVVLVIPSFNSGLIPRPGSDAQAKPSLQTIGTHNARPPPAQPQPPRAQAQASPAVAAVASPRPT